MGNLFETLRRIGPGRIGMIGVVGVGLAVFFWYLATRLTAPGYSLLYSDLDLKDSAQIVSKLDSMGISYQLKGDGSTLYVPADQVGRLRLTMAESGVPHGASIGYEIFDKSDTLGATDFQQGVNEMRALEGELGRTIQSLSVVEGARVHLVLPKRELFSREKQEPSASIVLHTRGANALGKSQIAAILNLVSTAVPGLKTSRISIIDQNGTLLARGGDSGATDAFSSGTTAEEQRVAYETGLSHNLEEMLERSVGYGHVRVDVNADMDFDRVTTNQESYDPDGQVVRSAQTTNESNENTQPGDQPVTVQNNLPNPPPGAQATPGKSHDTKTEETTNYEISKKVTSQTRETGIVKRLSVAVLVDGTYATDKGEKTYQPRSADDLAMLTKLVQSGIGYDEKRGDRVEMVNMRFAEPEEVSGTSTAMLFGFEKADVFRIGETLVALIVAILVIMLVLRPLMKRTMTDIKAVRSSAMASLPPRPGQGALPPPDGMSAGGEDGEPGTSLVTTDPDNMIDLGQVEGRVKASSIRKIGEIVEKHPEEAVSIIRSWMYETT